MFPFKEYLSNENLVRA